MKTIFIIGLYLQDGRQVEWRIVVEKYSDFELHMQTCQAHLNLWGATWKDVYNITIASCPDQG